MILDRRGFLLALASGSLANASSPRRPPRRVEDPVAPNVAIDLETFWFKRPFLERIKSLSDTGFKTFEFSRFKTKNYLEISKVAKELELSIARFTVFSGLADPNRKDSFLQALDDAIEVAEVLEVKELVLNPGEAISGVALDKQAETVLDRVDDAIEKIKDLELTILLDPWVRGSKPKQRLIADAKAAVALASEVDNKQIRLLVDLENGWTADSGWTETLKAGRVHVGAVRLASARLKDKAVTGGLEPAGLLRFIKELGVAGALGLELSPRENEARAIEDLKKADKTASLKLG